MKGVEEELENVYRADASETNGASGGGGVGDKNRSVSDPPNAPGTGLVMYDIALFDMATLAAATAARGNRFIFVATGESVSQKEFGSFIAKIASAGPFTVLSLAPMILHPSSVISSEKVPEEKRRDSVWDRIRRSRSSDTANSLADDAAAAHLAARRQAQLNFKALRMHLLRRAKNPSPRPFYCAMFMDETHAAAFFNMATVEPHRCNGDEEDDARSSTSSLSSSSSSSSAMKTIAPSSPTSSTAGAAAAAAAAPEKMDIPSSNTLCQCPHDKIYGALLAAMI